MNDEEIVGAWTTLEPPMLQRRRMDVRVSAWLEASDVSLAAEWATDGRPRLPRDRHLYWEWNGAHFAPYEPRFQAVRRDRWKLVRHAPDKPWELYDLSADRGETTNVAAANPAVVEELSGWIARNREPHLPQVEPGKPPGQRWR